MFRSNVFLVSSCFIAMSYVSENAIDKYSVCCYCFLDFQFGVAAAKMLDTDLNQF